MSVPPKNILFVALAGVLIALQIGYGVFVVCMFGRPEDAGTFGDMFGAFSSLLSGLGFIGVVLTLMHQIQASKEEAEDRKGSDKLQRSHVEKLERQISEFVGERRWDELKRRREKLEQVSEEFARYSLMIRWLIDQKQRCAVTIALDPGPDPRPRMFMLVRLYLPALRPRLLEINQEYYDTVETQERPDPRLYDRFKANIDELQAQVEQRIVSIDIELAPQ